MKKLIALCIGLLLVSTAQAQWGSKNIRGNGKVMTTERKTGDYDKIGVAGMFYVELVSGREGTITIHAEENLLEYIVTEVRGKALKIEVEKGINLKPGKRILITVPFEDISEVSLAGSGDITGKSPIRSEQLKVSVAGSGDIDLDIETNDLSSSVAGSGDIKLRGKAVKHKASIAGSGDISAYDLIAEEVNATIAGSGDIRVFCNEKIKATISGSGNVMYKGNPSKENSKSVGSGKVKKA